MDTPQPNPSPSPHTLPQVLAALGLAEVLGPAAGGAPRSHCIGGRWLASASHGSFELHNPNNGRVLATLARGLTSDVTAAVAAARAAQDGPWGRASAAERGRVLLRMSALVAERAEPLAVLEALDVGKPLRQGRADALALARYLEFYAGAADKLMGQTIPYASGTTVFTLREPHGVTGHIVPWNYPMQIIGRSVGAALAAGNACVLKPAEEACLTALAFVRIAHDAGLPEGALNVVTGLGEEAGAALAAHPGIDHLSFTGSFATGVLVQAAAAKNAVPVTLELGGKSPQLVFDDADLDAALPVLVNAAVQNAGQTCSAGSRVLVQRGVHAQLVQRLAERFTALVAGPALGDFDLGPLISARQKAIVQGYLALAGEAGAAAAQVVARGRLADAAEASGSFVEPALVALPTGSHRLAQEEIFGPVLGVLPFDDEAEALALANGTPYGLVAGVWTRDGARALRLARSLRCGQVFINNYGAGGGIELPFGGVKHSGHGREKGFEALLGFTTLKTVAYAHG